VPEQADPSAAAEAAFVERLRARDESAFNELVQLYERRIYALVYRMLGHRQEAEEITQEVFVQVFKCIEQFRGDSKLSTWLFRIAVNWSKNKLKYHSRRGGSSQQDYDATAETSSSASAQGMSVGSVDRPDELVAGIRLEQLVRLALEQVDPDFRELVVLRDVEDLSYEDIAAVTGLPRGTVKSRIHRGREQLRVRVEHMLGEKLGKTRKE
jgi:RNA polymerase sigma-70 factor (ECF subfamily)